MSVQLTDARYQWFVRTHGQTCRELDALNPVVLREAVEVAIYKRLDLEAWNRAAQAEPAECESIERILKTWPTISGLEQKYSDEVGI